MRVETTVNGELRVIDAEPRLTLADGLRDRLGLTGTHLGCEQGVCGACTVLLDGQAVRSCLTLAMQADGAKVETVEALGTPQEPSDLQLAFVRHRSFQCGFCTPGFLMSAEWLLRSGADLDRASLRELLAGNICRCTGYEPIIDAVLDVRSARTAAKGT